MLHEQQNPLSTQNAYDKQIQSINKIVMVEMSSSMLHVERKVLTRILWLTEKRTGIR